jgi:hypothetical protein
MSAWLELFRSLGQALLDLVQAELEAIGDELASSGKQLGVGIALLVAAAAFGFWTAAVAIYTVIRVIAIWLPLWASAAIVTGLFAIVVIVLTILGIARLRRLEGPVRTLGRHLHDHREWWNDHLLAGAEDRRRLEEGEEERE